MVSFKLCELVSALLYAIRVQASLHTVDGQSPMLLKPKITFRDATKADLDDIARISMDAFKDGPAFTYVHYDIEKYLNYTRYCNRQNIEEVWDNLDWNNVFAKVIAVSTEADDNSNTPPIPDRAVALGLWQIKDSTLNDTGLLKLQGLLGGFAIPAISSLVSGKDQPPYDCSLNLGTNTTRMTDVWNHLHEFESKYLDSQFPRQLYLALLATHPSWDGHNFAAMNLHWGMELAKSKSLPITLVGTPAGYPLYHSLGFENIKNATIKRLDGKGVLWYEVMKYESRTED